MINRSRSLRLPFATWIATCVAMWIGLAMPAWSQDIPLDDRDFGATAEAEPDEADAAAAAEAAARDAERAAKIRTIEQRLLTVQQVVRGLQRELRALKGSAPTESAEAPVPRPVVVPQPTVSSEIAQAPPPPVRPPSPATSRSDAITEAERAVSPDQEIPEFTPGALRESRAVLIREGLLEVDPRLGYTFSKRDVLDVSGVNIVEAIFVGTFRIGEVTTNRITPSLGFRYGYSRDLQFSLSIPYSRIERETILPDTVQSALSDAQTSRSTIYDLGDISAGFSYHIWKESDLIPDLILSGSVKTKTGKGPFDIERNESSTGTGFWGANLGITAVKVSDPGVLFGNFGYFYHHEDEVFDVDFDPPDSWDWGIGYSWALNPFLSLTTRIEGRFVEETRVNGARIRGSGLTIANLALGVTYAYSQTGSFDILVQTGLTDDSPDFSLTVSRPFIFDTTGVWDRIF